MIDDSAPEFPGASEDQMASAGSFDPACSGARLECLKLSAKLDTLAEIATEQQHQNGEYGNLRHDAEVMRMASEIFAREVQCSADTWRIHILGPDDIHPMLDELTALRQCNITNITLANIRLLHANDPNYPWAMAVVERNEIEYTKAQYLPSAKQ